VRLHKRAARRYLKASPAELRKNASFVAGAATDSFQRRGDIGGIKIRDAFSEAFAPPASLSRYWSLVEKFRFTSAKVHQP